MDKGVAINVCRLGNGFQAKGPDPLDERRMEELVFQTKKKLLRFIDSHFSEKRKKGEKAE